MTLALACILTIVIETAFFACTKYRKTRLFLLLCACANGATNLAMNVTVEALSLPYWTFLPAEILVVIVEYALPTSRIALHPLTVALATAIPCATPAAAPPAPRT